MYDYILFDLDGTISDNSVGILNGVELVLNHYSIPYVREELFSFIGPPLLDSFMDYAGLTREQATEAVKLYRRGYSVTGLYENKLYDGIENTLQGLAESGKELYLATAKPEIFAVKILEKFNILKYFSGVKGASIDGSLIEKGDIINRVLCENEIPVERAVMVGDREHDILGAKGNDLKSIGVSYGFGSIEELEGSGADHIVHSPRELLKLLLGE